jgi:urease accessory protein
MESWPAFDAIPAASSGAFDMASVRSRGEIRLGLRYIAGATRIDESYQSGCLRLRLPKPARDAAPGFVILNTAGGLVDDDRLDQRLRWGAGTSASVTTQAAEKVYRMEGAGAAITTRIDVGAGAEAEWLPQETILFDRARLTRSTEVRLADDARFLGCEAIVFGRTAMGETVEEGLLDDRWRIWRGGRLVYADALRLDGSIRALLARAAIGAGAAAMAILIHISPTAVSLHAIVREALAAAIGLAAASVSGALLIVRLLARDGAVLRHDLTIALAALRSGRPLPRVWGC